MFDFLKKMVCLSMICLILFTGIAIWGKGGDKFRWLGKKTGGIIRKGAEKLADTADTIRDESLKSFRKWSGEMGKKTEEP